MPANTERASRINASEADGAAAIRIDIEAGCLNRLQITVAPIIIGSGRPGIAFPGDRALDCALRPRIRRFDLGGDTLFDCDFDV
jgi:diaminohydroxyphosphoribosylaminopyrimidine deaminase / 5-amino-6-(5-phosphoribosylamino)uracil reductase